MVDSTLSYEEFINKKSFQPVSYGFDVDNEWINGNAKPHQVIGIKWALKRGRSALFFDTGLGKSLCLLNFAYAVSKKTDMPVLVLAPLAVGASLLYESEKFGFDHSDISFSIAKHQDDVKEGRGVYITNYEKLEHFDPESFSGVVLDESSILKGMFGRVREYITDKFKNTPYKLSLSATPSPNDYVELGTQAEFLGIMTQAEMLSMFFINDTANTGDWRLKKHAESKFWEWMATWCIVLRKPSDLGFSDEGYDLPPVKYEEIIVGSKSCDGLFVKQAHTLSERLQARKDSINERVDATIKWVDSQPEDESVLIWCDFNSESEMLRKGIKGAIEVKGSDKPEYKEEKLLGFADGTVKRLVTKSSIAGMGLNYQICNRMIFCGVSDSFERLYQSIRRCQRFGQLRDVTVVLVSSEAEGSVMQNIKRKQLQHDEMSDSMVCHMRELTLEQVKSASAIKTEYNPQINIEIPEWLKEESF